MKVEYKINSEDNYSMIISDLNGSQLDAIRIILKTATEYGKKAGDSDIFGLDNLLAAVLKPKEGSQ